ncbi:MAG: sensor histidine kinase [Butyricicoccus sp.]
MKLSDGDLSNHILQMLGADDAVFLLVSPDETIAALSGGARRLLRQKPLLPVSEVLSEDAAQAVHFVLKTGGESALDEEIDGHPYRLEIRPVEQGALLYFSPLEAQTQALPLPMYGQIIGSLSHILALLYLVPDADAGRQEQLLDSVRRDSLRIYRSLSHLQLLECADDPERILHMKEQNLTALCCTLCEKCAAAAAGRGRTAAVYCDTDAPCRAVFDEALMTRALLSLLTNALRAPNVTEVHVQVCPFETRNEAYVSVVVSDNGHGLPPEELDRLYHAWQRAQDIDRLLENQAEGVPYGLGLPLVRRIAGWHRGSLLLESGDGGGTVFRLVFPLGLPADPDTLRQSSPEDTVDLAELELSVL